jgi:hypothetical protein
MNIVKSSLALISTLLATLAAKADIVTQPDSLTVGDTYRLIFVTDGTIDATSGDLATYKDFATAEANSVPALAALGVEWFPVVSVWNGGDSLPAREITRTNPSGALPDLSPIAGFFTLGGERIAANNADLWSGKISSPVNISQTGRMPTGSEQVVWTGTQKSGWSTREPLGMSPEGKANRGSATTEAGGWINAGPRSSSEENSIYVMSDLITVKE